MPASSSPLEGPGIPPRHSEPSAVLIATDIEKSYRRGFWPFTRRQPVLAGASLHIASGEVVGLVGENGSGKSTLMKILVGALTADAGTVGRSGSLGYCPQSPLIYPRLTCNEHFELFAHAYRLTHAQATSATQAIYADLGFARFADIRADQLSGGTLAKLNLALALLPDPDLLLLDEPYAGFDWDTYQKFWTLVANRRQAGRSILVISHFIVDEDRFDRIIDLRDGLAVPR